MSHAIVVPPLKWAGGKRWFASNYLHFLPDRFDRYIEPFFGSGALFFSLSPEKSIISDINAELINLYESIRDQPHALENKLYVHQRKHDQEYYYKIREMKTRTKLTAAARMLYLNRTCWNGLYRVNLQGKFNVPKGTKDKVLLPTDNFASISQALQRAQLLCQDFESTINLARSGDFVFVDPPYTVAHNHNGFVKYNQNLFSWEDQVRLRNAVKCAALRGAKVLVTNAAHESIHELYKEFDQTVVERAGVIAGDSMKRGRFKELVARWY